MILESSSGIVTIDGEQRGGEDGAFFLISEACEPVIGLLEHALIPTALSSDLCPFSRSN